MTERDDAAATAPSPPKVAEAYWSGLRRAENAMPFLDDLTTEALGEAAGSVALFDVLGLPARFRTAFVGIRLAAAYPALQPGDFLDEIRTQRLPAGLADKCREAMRAGAPARAVNYVALPLWANGRIEAVLVALALP